jgi:uncharacterized protein
LRRNFYKFNENSKDYLTRKENKKTMDKSLLEILACPVCKGELIYDQNNQELICHFDRFAFPIINDIPIMLESRARRISLDEEG